jgi:hypothetical protein
VLVVAATVVGTSVVGAAVLGAADVAGSVVGALDVSDPLQAATERESAASRTMDERDVMPSS